MPRHLRIGSVVVRWVWHSLAPSRHRQPRPPPWGNSRLDCKPSDLFLPSWSPDCPAHCNHLPALLFVSPLHTSAASNRTWSLHINIQFLSPPSVYIHLRILFTSTTAFFIFTMAVAQGPVDHLDRLPVEIILGIIEQPCLSVRDMISLACTSRRHYIITISPAYKAHITRQSGLASK